MILPATLVVPSLFLALTALEGGPANAQPNQAPQSIPKNTVLAGTVVVPLDVSRGHAIVEARLNGRGPFRFFLDTGAGTMVLDDDLAKEVGLATIDTTRLGDPVNPQAILADVVVLDSVSIGAARFEGVRAVAWDRSTLRTNMPDRPRGVIGIGVFHDVLLGLDYPKSQLRLSRGLLPEADGARVLDYTSPMGIPVIPVRIGSRAWLAHLDSGSPGGFNLPIAEKDSVRLGGELEEIGRGRTANSELVIYGAPIADTLRIGAHAFPQAMIQFNDRLPHANLGARILREFVVTIDQKNHRLRLDRTGKPAPPPVPHGAPAGAPAAPAAPAPKPGTAGGGGGGNGAGSRP